MAGRQVVGPAGQDRHEMFGRDVADEERHEVPRRRVDPLHVFDGGKHRSGRTQPVEEAEEAFEQASPIDGRGRSRRRVRGGLGLNQVR